MIEVDEAWLSKDYYGFREWIQAFDSEWEIFDWLQQRTKDIDFETGLWLVSKWDDPLHILWSSNLGLHTAKTLRDDGFALLESWWLGPLSENEKNVLWLTLLCRSVREYCRRIWYDHVMPGTYIRRYRMEPRNHFLELASTALRHLNGYDTIRDFLKRSKKLGDDLWATSPIQREPEVVVAKRLSFPLPSPNPEAKKTVQIFLCYAREDENEVMKVYQRLKTNGFKPWMDKQDLLAGQNWREEIPKALRASDFALVFLSGTSVSKRGYVQTEFTLALEVMEEMPEGQIFIIPAKLEDCDIPDKLSRFYCVNLYNEGGFESIVRSIQFHA